jgi:hypothetical protein
MTPRPKEKSMSHYAEPTSAGPTSDRYAPPSAWVGWIAFAGVIMVLLGSFHIIQGLVALFNDEYFLVGKSGLVVNLDFTAWGWVHLIGGIIALFSAVVNLAFLGAYPIWSMMMIALAVVVILALTVHGSEVKP